MTDDELMRTIENAPIVFGLRAQGHLPTVERMLADGKTWDEIGKAINWEPSAARKNYELAKGKHNAD